jgi:hypothetical protein
MAERNTDTVPAMLTPGEFVITDKAVKKAGGPGFFYWLMNMLDPSSKKAREDGYQFGGSVLGSLLSRTQEKDEGPVYPKPDFTIPAGKNILGQTTEKMGSKEMTEMITQGGGASVVGMASQMGQGGIRATLSSNKEDILNMLAKMRKTGKGSKEIADAVDWQTELQKYLKQATSRRFTNPIKKQRGGSIDDYSLMDYMMPAMDKRLGPPLKKFQFGGYATDYQGNPVGPQTTGSGGYTSQSQYQYGPTSQTSGAQSTGMGGLPASGAGGLPTSPTGFGGGTTGAAQATLGSALATASAYTPPPSAQSQLIQPSDIYSTGIESIFQEMGYQTPGSEYLQNIQAYDPTQQSRMQQDLSRKLPGPVGGAGGFAGSGAAIKKAGEEREAVTQQYTRGSEDLRKQYREQIMQDVIADAAAGTYEFEDLG